MLPRNWDFIPLEQLASVERGKFTARPRNDPRYYGGSIPFVQTGDVVAADGVIKNYSQTLNEAGLGVSKLFPKGSILVTIAANIGDVAMTSIDVACPDSIVVVQANLDVCKHWLKYALSARKPIMEAAATQNAQKNINLQVLRPLPILTPPLKEQKRIAEILATWDEAIALTERAIEASQRLKDSLMQNLFSVHDSDFCLLSGTWRNVQLGEIFELNYGKGLDRSKYDVSGDSKVIGTAGVIGNSFHFLSQGPSVIVGRKGSLDQPLYIGLNDKFWSIDTTYYVTSREDMKFLYYLLKFIKLSRFNESTGVPSLNRNAVYGIKARIPDLDTQKKIVKILDVADLQTQKLQKLAGFYRKQKQGLMQKLLTGEWRVALQEAA